MSNEKRKDIYIMILSAFLVVVSIVAILFFIESRSVKETLVAKEQEYKSNLGNLNNDSATKVENTVVEKEVEKKVEVPVSQIITFDRTKVVNNNQNNSYVATSENEKLSLILENNKPYIMFKEDLTEKYLFNDELTNAKRFPIWEKIELTGFSKKVLNIKCSIIGQSYLDYTLLFLMEDGTVEYLNVYNLIKNNSTKTQGKINGLEGIVKLEDCIVSNPNNEASSSNVIAINNKGEAYDIKLLLIKQTKE